MTVRDQWTLKTTTTCFELNQPSFTMDMAALAKCSATSADDTWSELRKGDWVKVLRMAMACGDQPARDVGMVFCVTAIPRQGIAYVNGLYYPREWLAKLPQPSPVAPAKPEPVGMRWIKVSDHCRDGYFASGCAEISAQKAMETNQWIARPRIFALPDLPVDPATGVVLDAERLMELGYEFQTVGMGAAAGKYLITNRFWGTPTPAWYVVADTPSAAIRAAAEHYLANLATA